MRIDALEPLIKAALTDVGAASPRTEHIVRRLAHEAYAIGHDAAIHELVTVPQAALELGITEGRVRTIARTRNLGWRIGREYLFRATDIDAMRDRKPGRPKRE